MIGEGSPERSALIEVSRHVISLPPVPAAMTTLVGRDRELADLVALIESPSVRLVTLTGPGGIGKTRLGLEAVHRAPRGAFVSLASVSNPDQVSGAISTQLGIESRPGRTQMETLADGFGSERLLLLLDNLEHLVDSADQIAQLIVACEGLTVVVTSRIRLGLAEEHVVPVESLETPAAEGSPALGEQCETASVRLFVERARAVLPTFALTNWNVDAVRLICRQLEGVPLALELAAARSNMLSPASLASRLRHRLDLLTGGPRDTPGRLRTMRAAIEWSYELLPEPVRVFWERLAVFRDGFTFDAATAVGACVELDDIDPMICLESLIGQSLLNSTTSSLGETRFSMLETTREYALERLHHSDTEDSAREFHARHILEYARTLQDGLKSPDASPWQSRTTSEIANIRLAIAWFRDHDLIQEAMQLVSRLEWFWTIPNFVAEGRNWCEQLLENVNAGVDPITLGAILDTAGTLADWHNDTELADGYFRRAVQIWRDQGDNERLAAGLLGLGSTSVDGFRFEDAEVFLLESYDLACVAGDDWNMASAASLRGVAAGARGDHATSIQFHETALSTYQQGGYLAHARVALIGIALGNLFLGDYERSWENYESVITLCGDTELYSQVPIAIEGFAQIAVRNQQIERGVRLLGAASTQRKQLGLQSRPYIQQRLVALIEEARRTIGNAHFSLAWATGQAMTQSEAYTEARSVTCTSAQSIDELTRRELDVLALLIEGTPDIDIADQLFITRRTASKYVASILDKLGAPNRTAAAIIALRRGLP